MALVRVALPVPLRRLFDYRLPPGVEARPGMRVRVPFGRREHIGVVMALTDESEVAPARLKAVHEVLDEAPLLDAAMRALLEWAAGYYHHPIGEVVASALPARLRQGAPARGEGVPLWRAVPEAAPDSVPARASRQRGLLQRLLQAGEAGLDALTLEALEAPGWREALKKLEARGLVRREQRPCWQQGEVAAPRPGPPLNEAQQAAVATVTSALDSAQVFLLQGVTGSGKTEVYLRIIEQVLARGAQALVLVPEIGLTPQLVRRFRERLGGGIAVLHSGLNDRERHCAWQQAASGAARVVIGTRSAVFTPLPRLGLVVVDEEHDASLKQQEGFRYHARDLAVMRAWRAGVPALLGSATPTLEALQRVREGPWRRLSLPARAGAAVAPRMGLVDLRADAGEEGLSRALLGAMQRHLEAGNQVLLFLNRRGWAPVLLCQGCGHIALCHRCDARLTWHARQRLLRCHHCGHEERPPERCPACGAPDLVGLGQGTQRVEEALARHFPGLAVERIDRDSTARRGALEAALERARSGEARILIGTQMLAKGHDFPGVTLVGMLDADQGLFSADLRAAERMAQLIVQVAGRAGRSERPGEVLIQTRQPEHPLLQALVRAGYEAVADRLLDERRAAGLPPFGHLALLRCESSDETAGAKWLQGLVEGLAPPPGVQLWGPVPAPMARRAGRWRHHLLLLARTRPPLHGAIEQLLARIESDPGARRLRWSLDVDPVDLY